MAADVSSTPLRFISALRADPAPPVWKKIVWPSLENAGEYISMGRAAASWYRVTAGARIGTSTVVEATGSAPSWGDAA